MTQLQQIEAETLVPHGAQTLLSTSRQKRPVPYVDRSSGLVWPSGGPLPFLAFPLFQGWAVGLRRAARPPKPPKNTTITPGVESLRLTPLGPSVVESSHNTSALPTAASLVLLSVLPNVALTHNVSAIPQSPVILLEPAEPDVASQNPNLSPRPAALASAPVAPDIFQRFTVTPQASALSVALAAPSLDEWLLDGGAWSDAGIWQDTNVWIDS